MPLADTPSGLVRLHKLVRRACGSFSDVVRMLVPSWHENSERISDEGTRRDALDRYVPRRLAQEP
jgi:hypothetical protein